MVVNLLRTGLRGGLRAFQQQQVRFASDTGNGLSGIEKEIHKIASDIFSRQAVKLSDVINAMRTSQNTALIGVGLLSGLLSGGIFFLGQELRADNYNLRSDVHKIEAKVNSIEDKMSLKQS